MTFKILLPLGISDDLPWGGYGFFSGTAHAVVCSNSCLPSYLVISPSASTPVDGADPEVEAKRSAAGQVFRISWYTVTMWMSLAIALILSL